MQKPIAHFDHSEKRRPHYLREHVDEMLELINSFQLEFDLYNITNVSAILHDVGKKCVRYQKYVQDPYGKRGSVKHAIGGAYLLAKKKAQVGVRKNFLVEFVANIVAGHHVGLDNHDKLFFDKVLRLPDELTQIEQLAEAEIEKAMVLLDESRLDDVQSMVGNEKFKLYISILVRFVMSGLVDADYLSTEAYFSKEKKELRLYDSPSFVEFQKELDHYIAKEFSKAGASLLNKLKKQVQVEAFEAGRLEGSFFSLHAPTGIGKTIASLNFALEHAKKYNKRRIITALPLTNLTEETSNIYKSIFGENHVIEDHSNTSMSDKDDGSIRLAAENWDRSYVVTTTVQLFESLLSHRPMKLRKLHRLANSIIILDEYHKLPLHVLEPILQHLDVLQKHFNVTVLLMSATPFPLLESQKITEMNLQAKSIEITDYGRLFEAIPSRVKYEWKEQELSINDLAERLASETAVLTIVNTRKEAQTLHKFLINRNHQFEAVYYLTTTMCGAHREQMIKEIRNKRNPNNPRNIAVISTSILEAGIDVSFPSVYRMLAPLDSIIQAAGRCNRYAENELGRVVIFRLKDASPVATFYKAGIEHTFKILQEKGSDRFMEPDSFVTYYRRLFNENNLNKIDLTHKTCLNFKDQSQSFRMIEDDRIAVVCTGFNEFKEEWLHENKTSTWWRKIQPYTVSVSSRSADYEEVNGVRVWRGTYDEVYGILL